MNNDQGAVIFVASLFPATAARPDPARRVNFLKALFVHWLLPRRYGPHLAVDSLRRALAAHVLAVATALTVLGLPTVIHSLQSTRGIGTLTGLRILLAEWVLDVAAESAFTGISAATAVAVVGCIPLAQVIIVWIATATMPWCADGDRASSVWKRSLKNVYWSTTVVIPAAAAISAVRASGLDEQSNDTVAILLGLVTLTVPLYIVLRMWLVGAGRYVGEPDGPAFAPREPCCDECGYALIKLSLETNCPECGLPVRDSLPGGRRRPTVWQKNELRPRGFLDLIRLQWIISRRPAFFKRLPVQSGLGAARHFWWGTYLLMAFCGLAAFAILDWVGLSEARWAPHFSGFALLALPLPFVLQSAMMFIACLSSQTRHGLRDYRVSAVACYYAAPLMWPLLTTLAPTAITGWWFLQGVLGTWSTPGEKLAWALSFAGSASLTLGCLWFWASRLAAALRDVRYSNL